ncbi:MAG: hypothetical protein ACOYEV_09715 [Candidatus Nanopelagicales bacterium]
MPTRLAGAEILPRKSLFAVVTDANQAIQTAIAVADSGQLAEAGLVLALNPQAQLHPIGLGLSLLMLIAADAPEESRLLADRIRAGGDGAPVTRALEVIAPELKSEVLRAAVLVVKGLLAV